jgi:hypothetical protein
VPAVAVIVIVTACASTGHAAAPPAASARARASTPAASPSTATCKLKTAFDYLVRTTSPDLAASAQEIGNVDLANCTPFLQDFTQTAGTASGECTTIALASDNPGYNADASPAPPLRKVIQSAGPGC